MDDRTPDYTYRKQPKQSKAQVTAPGLGPVGVPAWQPGFVAGAMFPEDNRDQDLAQT